MIDWQQAATLREEIGDEGFEDVLALYLQETEATLASFGRPGADAPALLHALRGSALTIGFAALAEMCGRLEAEARRGLPVQSAAVAGCYAMSRAIFLRNRSGAGDSGRAAYSTNCATVSSAVMSR